MSHRLPVLLAKMAEARKAERARKPPTVVLDLDVAEIFQTSKEVNTALRSLIAAIPRRNGLGPLPGADES
jgi:hypothetical protein